MEVTSPNTNFLKKINPVKVILMSFLIWFILFITSPLEIKIDIDYSGYILIFISIIAFILGFKLKRVKNKTGIRVINSKKAKQMFNLILFLAVIGFMFKVFDRFFIRGISLGSNFFENRESMETGGGNIVGIITAFLIPFSYIPLFLYWSFKIKLNRVIVLLTYFVFFFQIFDALLLGSRSVIFILGMMLFLYLNYFKKFQFTFFKVIQLLLVALLFSLLMTYMFIERTKIFAGDSAYQVAMNTSNFNYTLSSNDKFKSSFANKSEVNKLLSFTYISTVQYFTHGMFEYVYLFKNFKGDYSLGSSNFIVYKRFVDKVFGIKTDTKRIMNLAPRTGVYKTLFGPLYIDFGWFTIVFMFFFGRFTCSVYNKALAGSDWALLSYFYLFIVLLFSPVFNFISGAGGLFLFTCFMSFRLLNNKIIMYEKIY